MGSSIHDQTRAERSVRIGGRSVSSRDPVYLIAEAGVNHNGRMELAHRMVEAAAGADVDAVKFQIFQADQLAAAGAHKPQYMLETDGPTGSQRDLLAGLALGVEQFAELKDHAESLGLEFLASPFDSASVEQLVGLGVRAIKLASTELVNMPLLEQCAAKGLPLVLSTGTCDMTEIAGALSRIRHRHVILLHCVSAYPVSDEDVNLRAVTSLSTAFHVPVGFSDHTVGLEAAPLAVAAGACVLEKHFTLDRALPGPDHRFSLPPEYLAEWVRRVRWTEQMLGDGYKRLLPCEQDVKLSARKSVVVLADVPAGTVLDRAVLGTKRPGTGIEPRHIDLLAGRRVVRDIPADTVLTWEMLSGGDIRVFAAMGQDAA